MVKLVFQDAETISIRRSGWNVVPQTLFGLVAKMPVHTQDRQLKELMDLCSVDTQ